MLKFIKKQIFLIIFLFFLFKHPALAQEIDSFSLKLDVATLKKGYTASVFNGALKIGILPGILNTETFLIFKKYSQPEKIFSFPQDKKLVSDVFEFDFFSKESLNKKKPFFLELKYLKDADNLKQAYFYDQREKKWKKLPSKSDLKKKTVKSLIHLPYAPIAVFQEKDIKEIGLASWYKYKECDCAASPDYPKGTKLKVTNLENYKSVIVKINDYGPDRSMHPERAIDLDVIAFKQIASIRQGLIKVKVEEL